MTESSLANGHDALEEKLGRLSKKPGVKASIILDRTTGAILKTSGQIDALQTSKTRTTSTATSFSNEGPALEESETKGVEQFAANVWNYVNSSGSLVQELDGEDELKLLRLRTRKQELVIVPDPKYLLVVVHDTPPA
ncbi:dynein light chain roadblock-type [Fusarium denticulatum]|uniref:Dynein light chain roadblock-type n=1 Tax=Fusarium denticulatum TaxID=48507 RepID=A0A8H5UJQ0_9HYPO|nr:dynein light chain roadblock-type [Fusarium denticulatum]